MDPLPSTRTSQFVVRKVWFLLLVAFVWIATGCASAPVESLEAAAQAIDRAKSETTGPACDSLVQSAEGSLRKARLAMETKDYETAKTEAFEALRSAYDAHFCNEISSSNSEGSD